jgi:hypothetical protein
MKHNAYMAGVEQMNSASGVKKLRGAAAFEASIPRTVEKPGPFEAPPGYRWFQGLARQGAGYGPEVEAMNAEARRRALRLVPFIEPMPSYIRHDIPVPTNTPVGMTYLEALEAAAAAPPRIGGLRRQGANIDVPATTEEEYRADEERYLAEDYDYDEEDVNRWIDDELDRESDLD